MVDALVLAFFLRAQTASRKMLFKASASESRRIRALPTRMRSRCDSYCLLLHERFRERPPKMRGGESLRFPPTRGKKHTFIYERYKHNFASSHLLTNVTSPFYNTDRLTFYFIIQVYLCKLYLTFLILNFHY